MDEQDKKIIRAYLKARHSLLINGVLYVAAAFIVPAFVSYLSNVGITKTIKTASMWINSEFSDCSIFSRELMIVTLGLQTGILLFAFGLSYLFNYTYTEYKFRSVFKYLKQAQSVPPVNE